jgi:hypothetical protein
MKIYTKSFKSNESPGRNPRLSLLLLVHSNRSFASEAHSFLL